MADSTQPLVGSGMRGEAARPSGRRLKLLDVVADGCEAAEDEAPSEEFASVLASCLRRIFRWRVPPYWSGRDWYEEIEAEAVVIALEAMRDYDPARGVPLGAFLRLRIRRRALAVYRREWAYAIRRRAAEGISRREDDPRRDAARNEALLRALQGSLGELPPSDVWIIEGLFWGQKSEAWLAGVLGVTQQAINKRKRKIYAAIRHLMATVEMPGDK